jgi:hypothetical protein
LDQGAWANILPKSNRNGPICFSPYLYRNRIERFFNRIKQCRGWATRYDKLAANYLAFVQLASIRLWLRVMESRANRHSGSSAADFVGVDEEIELCGPHDRYLVLEYTCHERAFDIDLGA